ncbi:hypothetical protein Ddc_00074 [Ditylenchus destructor]|nr:hypothetical protein Ddc_00074 [Ditylenchus destructor]
MKLSVFAFFAAAVLGPELCLATLHNITVKGQLLCDNVTVSNVNVELREHDTYSIFKVCTRATEYDVPEKKLDSVYDMGSISLNLQNNNELGRRYDRDSEECD